MAVLPDHIGADHPTRFAPTAQDQDRARTFQRMPLHHEVVLPAYATEHPAIFELVRHPGTEQGHGESTVDKAGIAPLQALKVFLAVQLVDIADRGHIEGV
ncbi:hypothetical protein D9M71_354630 [compost metagenome]